MPHYRGHRKPGGYLKTAEKFVEVEVIGRHNRFGPDEIFSPPKIVRINATQWPLSITDEIWFELDPSDIDPSFTGTYAVDELSFSEPHVFTTSLIAGFLAASVIAAIVLIYIAIS